jgi:hypothetical protein
MAHPTKVSNAIQAALADINLLRPLTEAKNAAAANDILTRYDSRLGLSGTDLDDFWASLKHGVMTMDASALVDYYDSLQPPPPSTTKTVRGRPQEWTP